MCALLFDSGIYKTITLSDVIVDLKQVPELCTVKVRMYVRMYVLISWLVMMTGKMLYFLTPYTKVSLPTPPLPLSSRLLPSPSLCPPVHVPC